MSSQDSKVVVRRFLSTVIAERDADAAAQVLTKEEIAENQRVSVRYIWSGTHRGAVMGIAPTGRHVRVAVAADKVAEEWHLDDTLGLLRQLGVAPEPGVAVPA
jgi:predicted ester cyclase